MASELQQIASRTNGAKSHGPLTEEGKQASARNSLNHGFNSKRIVLPGESQEEFDQLLASYLDEHQPETPTERTLIENMAVARWRQQRVWTLETAGLTAEMRRPRYIEGEDPETQAFVAFRSLTDGSHALELLNRYEARFERQFRAALNSLLTLRAKRRTEERTDARADADASTKHVKVYWVDEEDKDKEGKDGQDKEAPMADTLPDPETAPSGSFGTPEKTRVTNISRHKYRDPFTGMTP